MTVGLSGLYTTGQTVPTEPFSLSIKLGNSQFYTFTGNHNGLVLPISTSVPSSLTFGVWIKPSSVSGVQNILSKNSYFATGTGDFPLSFSLTSSSLGLNLDGGNDFSPDLTLNSSGVTITTGAWRHIGFSYSNNGQSRLYIDGVVNASTSINFSVGNNSRNWTLGKCSFFNSGDSQLRYSGDMFDPFIAIGEQSDFLIATLFQKKPFIN
jgi:hypothetical protein